MQPSSVSVRYDRDKLRVRLHGSIDNNSIFALCDEINLAVDYYHYQDVEIEIDSFGGVVSSLEYYLGHLKRWREERRVRISTLGMTTAASAAAVILSMGDIGHRRAYRSSRLLYHDTRFLSNNETWTKNRLEEAYKQLHETDDRLLNYLVSHVYERLIIPQAAKNAEPYRTMLMLKPNFSEIASVVDPEKLFVEMNCGDADHLQREQILAAYQALYAFDVFIPPHLACKMFLIDEITDF